MCNFRYVIVLHTVVSFDCCVLVATKRCFRSCNHFGFQNAITRVRIKQMVFFGGKYLLASERF